MNASVYNYEALAQADNDIKQTIEKIRDNAQQLISDAQKLQEQGWQGESASGYNDSAQKLMSKLNGFGSYLEQQKKNLSSGAEGMRSADSSGGKRMAAYS